MILTDKTSSVIAFVITSRFTLFNVLHLLESCNDAFVVILDASNGKLDGIDLSSLESRHNSQFDFYKIRPSDSLNPFFTFLAFILPHVFLKYMIFTRTRKICKFRHFKEVKLFSPSYIYLSYFRRVLRPSSSYLYEDGMSSYSLINSDLKSRNKLFRLADLLLFDGNLLSPPDAEFLWKPQLAEYRSHKILNLNHRKDQLITSLFAPLYDSDVSDTLINYPSIYLSQSITTLPSITYREA